MKFGFLAPNYGPTAAVELIVYSARLAEDLGFDSIWTTDHVMVPEREAIPYGNLIESLISLALIAQETKRVAIGTSIIVLPQREPILLAKQLAAIDRVSNGRLIFGAGTGWLEEEFNYLRAPFEKRGKVFEEYLDVLRTLWRGEEFFSGEFVSFENALFSPLPVQRDDIPIWIAGNSNIAIRRAATMADGWHPVGLGPDELFESVQQLRSISNGRNVSVSLRAPVALPGKGGLEEQLGAAAIESWNILGGSVDDIANEIANYARCGLDHIIMWFFHKDMQELEDSLTEFANEIIPRFR